MFNVRAAWETIGFRLFYTQSCKTTEKKKNYKRPEMFSQPVTQLMCFFKWKSNDDWEGNGFPPDQIQALVSFFIYLPIYLFIFIYHEGN